MMRLQRLQGFTVVEVMAAMVIFALASTASLAVLSSSIQSTRDSIDIEEGLTLAVEEIERQRSALIPSDVPNETIDSYTRNVAVNGCTFAGTNMSCAAANCDATVAACLITVTVTNDLTNETITLTSIKITEQL